MLNFFSRSTIITVAIVAVTMMLASAGSIAGENLWVYAKGTDTRPQDSFEFKLSDIIRLDKNAGSHYRFYDIRPEIEYGITDKLTVFAGVMLFSHDYDVGSEQERGPCPMCEAGEFDPQLQRSSFDLSDFRVGSRHQYGNYFGPAVATSGNYFLNGQYSIICPQTGKAKKRGGSVSVFAANTMLADALTKAVWLTPRDQLAPLLKQFNAKAVSINRIGMLKTV